MSKRNIFKETKQETHFKEHGFVLTPGFLNSEEISLLRAWYTQTPNDLGQGFHATTHSKDIDYRRKVTELISKVFQDKIRQILHEYRPVVGTFTVKEPGPKSFFDFHLDWSMVDESQHISITAWVSLEDTTENNGNLWILDRSVHHGNSYRCSPGLHMLVENKDNWGNLKFQKQALAMKAGDAIIYNHKLIHGSPPNLSDQARIAINMVYLPKEAKSVHYTFEDKKIHAYIVDDDFYHRCLTCEETSMDSFQKINAFDFKESPITREEINGLIME